LIRVRLSAAIGILLVASAAFLQACGDDGSPASGSSPGVTGEPAASGQSPAAATQTPGALGEPITAQVYWPGEQIVEAQEAALAQGNILLADTWSSEGGEASNGETYSHAPIILIAGFEAGDTFYSPLAGQVEGVYAAAEGSAYPLRQIRINVGTDLLIFEFAADNKVLVEGGEQLEPGTPLATMTGSFIPEGEQLSAPAQVALFNATKDGLSSANVLTDGLANLVGLEPAAQ